MDLYRLLERRYLIGIPVAFTVLWAIGQWGVYARSRADMVLYPPAPKTVSPLAADMIKTSEARESAKLHGLHRAISAEIAAAAANGFDVARLQRVADNALQLDTPAYRSTAIERLNRLRLAIPLKKEGFRPAAAGDLSPDTLETPRPKTKSVKKRGRPR